ncbi:hypothetical protein Tco_0817356 [Tanacetum coccineum]
MMDRYTNNALWDYWKRGDDEEVLTDDELSNPGDGNLFKENKIAEIEPTDNIDHVCEPLRFKSGHAEWPTYYEWYDALEDSNLKEEALNNKAILEKSMDVEEESSEDAWSHYSPIDEWEDFERADHIETNANPNYNPHLDISRIFNNHAGTNNDGTIQDENDRKGDDGDNIDDLDDYLVSNDSPFIIDEEEERFKERRFKLLRIPYVKPPTCKSVKFKVVKHSFGPTEEYVAIKEYEYGIWV